MRRVIGNLTLPVNAALDPFLRVKLTGGYLAAAGANEQEIGVLEERVIGPPQEVAASVIPLNDPAVRDGVAAVAITIFDLVYTAAGGTLTNVAGSNGQLRGMATTAAGGAGSHFQYLPFVYGETPGGVGTSGSHATDATSGGSALGIFVDPTAATAARYTTLCVESLLDSEIFTTQGAGLYGVRGVAGLKAGATYKGSANQGFLAGVQGKLTMTATSVLGDGNSGGIYACAILAQMQLAAGAAFGADVEVFGLWVDNQVGAALPATSHLLNLTNNGGALTNLIHGYGNNAVSYVLNLETMGSAVVAQTGVTTLSKSLKIKIDGTTYYIPCCTGTT